MDGFSIKVKVEIVATMELRGKDRHRYFWQKEWYQIGTHWFRIWATYLLLKGFIISL